MTGTKCRCDSKPCAGGCPCSKAGSLCTPACHMGKPWASVPCLNTEPGLKVKPLKPAEVRLALCSAGLSPVGDKAELLKRLAVHYSTLTSPGPGGGETEDKEEEVVDDTKEELMNAIMANEGDYVFVLSLSGKYVSQSSSKTDLRKAYLMVSTKVHPDKNPGNQLATKAFQVVVESFERLANPEKFEEDEEDEEGKPKKKRQKTERFTRDNKGCFSTVVKCPRCRQVWNTRDLGLEDAAYNFLMQGIKQFLCGGCFAKFGCMTAIHKCPKCNKTFEYDPDDYHRQICCGSAKCTKEGKTFGFMMFKVSEKREVEVRKEVKVENEALAKKRAQQKRRNARFDKREGAAEDESGRVQEQLFLLKLLDNCPRCGWELERGLKVEDARNHLDTCNDKKKIAAHQATLASKKAKVGKKKEAEESQEDMMAFKTWEHNGRQVGQLWMLSLPILRQECRKLEMATEGSKVDLITRLGRVIRDRERKMITMDSEKTSHVSHDVTPIHQVDDDDLPANMEGMEREELQCVAASYGIDFDHKGDVKLDLVRKLERARLTGRGLLMITDEGPKEKEEGESDEDYEVEEEED